MYVFVISLFPRLPNNIFVSKEKRTMQTQTKTTTEPTLQHTSARPKHQLKMCCTAKACTEELKMNSQKAKLFQQQNVQLRKQLLRYRNKFKNFSRQEQQNRKSIKTQKQEITRLNRELIDTQYDLSRHYSQYYDRL